MNHELNGLDEVTTCTLCDDWTKTYLREARILIYPSDYCWQGPIVVPLSVTALAVEPSRYSSPSLRADFMLGSIRRYCGYFCYIRIRVAMPRWPDIFVRVEWVIEGI
jgi:hypothetical protein